MDTTELTGSNQPVLAVREFFHLAATGHKPSAQPQIIRSPTTSPLAVLISHAYPSLPHLELVNLHTDPYTQSELYKFTLTRTRFGECGTIPKKPVCYHSKKRPNFAMDSPPNTAPPSALPIWA